MSNATRRRQIIKIWIKILVTFLIVAIISIVGIIISAPGRQEIQNLVINTVDFKKLHDGTYIGEYKGTKDSLRDTMVEVTILGGKISNIKILKGALDKNGMPLEIKDGLTVDDIFDNVVKLNKLQVDAISGATLTSKAHLKALENALKQAEID